MATRVKSKPAKAAKSARAAKRTNMKTARAVAAPAKTAPPAKVAAASGGRGALIKRDDLFSELDAWFDRTLRRGGASLFDLGPGLLGEATEMLGARAPQVDVVNREKDVLVRAELPGVQKKDVDVSLTDRMLTIRASSSQEKKEEKGDFFRREISEQSFARTITLPSNTDPARARAELKDGVLEIVIPKQAGAKGKPLDVS